MPQFAPGESKTAIAPITVSPSGMNCEAEIFLGPNDTTKVATSGRVSFVSTGAAKNVSLPIVMPSASGSYHGYVDVLAGGLRFLAYLLTEDVVIAAPIYGVNFGTLTGSIYIAEAGTKYDTVELHCSIINPNSVQVTPTITLMYAQYHTQYNQWVQPDNTYGSSRADMVVSRFACMVNPFTVTLAPGASLVWSVPGFCTLPAGYSANIWLGRYLKTYYYLIDQLGHKSNEIMLASQGA